jgi:hypothetical protein
MPEERQPPPPEGPPDTPSPEPPPRPTPTVTLEQDRFREPGTGEDTYSYKVVQTTGTTTPRIWEVLTEEDVQGFINDGFRVTIKPPRS